MNKTNEQPCGAYYNHKTDELYISVWKSQGGRLTNRTAVSPTDPEHQYNLALRVLKGTGRSPEEFNITSPLVDKYKDMSRADLMMECYKLEEEMNGMLSSGMF